MTTEAIERKKCHATNRQGQSCGNWPMVGERVCKFHGAVSARKERGKPKPSSMKHGLYRTAIGESLAPAYEAAFASVIKDDGATAVASGIATRASLVTAFFKEHPGGPTTPQEHEALARALSGIDQGVKARADLISAHKQETPTSVTFAVPNLGEPTTFAVRGPGGDMATALRGPNGEVLLQGPDGAWREHVEGVDDETGAPIYRPLLQAHAE